MERRGTRPFLLSLLLAAAAWPALAQLAPPRLVSDEEAIEEAEATTAVEPLPPPAAGVARPSSSSATGPAAASEHRPARAAGGIEAAAAARATLPAPPPPPAAPDLAREIVPVKSTYADLLARWGERRAALREADPARADAAARALLAARRDLGIGDMVPLAAAEMRESARALGSNLRAAAVAHAQVAVELAPGFPDAHLALARALFAQAPSKPAPALAAIGDAIAVAAREPHILRAFIADVASAGLAAVFTAAVALVVLLLARRLRLFLHDFHHLPLLRGSASVQTTFLAVVLLGVPLAFGLGAFATLAVLLFAAWLYLSTAERVVATAALAALLALPWAAGEAARLTAWTGSVAERVHELEHGAPSDEEVAELAALAADRPAPPAVYAALGRHYKRRGRLDEALRWYRAAAEAGERAPEIDVNVANVLFLKGDLEGAKAAYLAATDRAGRDLVVLGAANYGLSKLYLRTSDMEKSAAAREKAESQAGAFLRAHGSDDDFTANRYLVDVPVPAARLVALAGADASVEAVRAWTDARIAGALPRRGWPWTGVAFLGLLWLLALATRRLAPAHTCERCGGPACRRCDAAAGELCGQCVNVFLRKGVVDARDRLRKEAQVRRHERITSVATRILAVVGGGAGHVWHGATVRGALLVVVLLFLGFVIWFWRGVMPPPHPTPYALLAKLAVVVPAALVVWVIAVKDAFQRTR